MRSTCGPSTSPGTPSSGIPPSSSRRFGTVVSARTLVCSPSGRKAGLEELTELVSYVQVSGKRLTQLHAVCLIKGWPPKADLDALGATLPVLINRERGEGDCSRSVSELKESSEEGEVRSIFPFSLFLPRLLVPLF